MGDLLFIRRSCAYRHAARQALRAARELPAGAGRDQVRQRARALLDLAREEAWLEGQLPRQDARQGSCIPVLIASSR
jgi:protein-disulfide isomerase